MKGQKTNAFQLAIAGAVLVLVLVCATFAWFASGHGAWVKSIVAQISSPSIPAQLNYIEYSPTGGEEAEDWAPYDGEILPIEPGQEWHFRVAFNAASSDKIQMRLVNIHNENRLPEKPEEGDDTGSSSGEGESPDDAESGKEPASTLAPTDTPALLAGVLEYRVNSNNDDDYKTLSLEAGNRTAVIYGPKQVGGTGPSYMYYYDIKMSEGAGNEYMNQDFSCDLELIFGSTLETTSKTSAEG